MAILNTTAAEGFKTVACPTFGGFYNSCPTLVLEKSSEVLPQVFMVFKNTAPGKVLLGGASIASDETLQQELLDVLKTFGGTSVLPGLDTVYDYDKSFEIAFKKTVLTSGKPGSGGACSMREPYFPHGFVVEMLLQVMFKHGWAAEGE